MVAREIFKKGTYDKWICRVEIGTVIDLGCNTGFFTCYLAGHVEPDSIEGLLVDADSAVLDECRWHLSKNGMSRCRTLCSAVGPDLETCDFFVSEFNISSSVKAFGSQYPFPIRSTQTVSVHVITLKELIDSFRGRRVNILKIDIEGSELELLSQDLDCLRSVDWIVVEWHKWVLQLADVEAMLNNTEFVIDDILKEDEICGLALFRNAQFVEC